MDFEEEQKVKWMTFAEKFEYFKRKNNNRQLGNKENRHNNIVRRVRTPPNHRNTAAIGNMDIGREGKKKSVFDSDGDSHIREEKGIVLDDTTDEYEDGGCSIHSTSRLKRKRKGQASTTRKQKKLCKDLYGLAQVEMDACNRIKCVLLKEEVETLKEEVQSLKDTLSRIRLLAEG